MYVRECRYSLAIWEMAKKLRISQSRFQVISTGDPFTLIRRHILGIIFLAGASRDNFRSGMPPLNLQWNGLILALAPRSLFILYSHEVLEREHNRGVKLSYGFRDLLGSWIPALTSFAPSTKLISNRTQCSQ